WCPVISGFRAWGGRSQPRSSRCYSELGTDLGASLQQGFGVPAAGPDIYAQTQPALNNNAGIDPDGLVVRVRHYCLPLATPTIEPLLLRLRHLLWTKYKLGRSQKHTKLYPSFQNGPPRSRQRSGFRR